MANYNDLELNEAGWWSYWTDLQWFAEKSYVMLSSEFGEYFFNRAGFLDCDEGRNDIAMIEAKFGAVGKAPCFSVHSGCKELVDILETRGYRSFDEMSVMQLDSPRFKKATGLTVLQGQDVGTKEWAATYARSFYGDLSLVGPVTRVLDRLAGDTSVVLFAGKKNGSTLGVLAAFRTPGLLGVYCVGTIEEQRETGVAGSLIHEANDVASAEGRRLALQTIVSDGVEEFYARGGFRRLYLKQLMKTQDAATESAKGSATSV